MAVHSPQKKPGKLGGKFSNVYKKLYKFINIYFSERCFNFLTVNVGSNIEVTKIGLLICLENLF